MVVSAQNFDSSKLTFGKPRVLKAQHGEYKIVPLVYEEKNKLVVLTDKCFSWGLQKDKEGFKVPILLKNKNKETGELEPTERQEEFLELFRGVLERSKQLCPENKKSLGRPELEKADLKPNGGRRRGVGEELLPNLLWQG